MVQALLVGAMAVIVTVIIHMVGLMVLLGFMRVRSSQLHPHRSSLRHMVFVVGMVMGLVIIHTIEMFFYAGLYELLGVFEDWEASLYFSISAFTTLGQGDVFIDGPWRIVGAIEAFNGFLLIGWSTAFLFSVLGRLRAAEFEFLDHLADDDDED